MDKIDIAFVILHYLNDEDTIECVESIINKVDTDNYKVVIVDNGSDNGSIERVINHFTDFNIIHYVMNKQNLGFSRGFNCGIRYVRSMWDARYIAVINNDIILFSDNLLHVLNEKYLKYQFAVFGPMIITRDGDATTNPVRMTVKTLKEAQRDLKKTKVRLKLCNLHCELIYDLFSRAYNAIMKKKKKAIVSDVIDCKLHGCFWVFSEKYFERFAGLKSLTFLYGEEDILHRRVLHADMHTVYSPDYVVYHKEDGATDMVFKKSKEKREYIYKMRIKALQAYIGFSESLK